MVFLSKFLKTFGAHEFLLLSIGVFKIEIIDAKLVRHDDVLIIFDSSSHPVMTTDGLKPPDFIFIAEGNAVWFVGSIFFKKLT